MHNLAPISLALLVFVGAHVHADAPTPAVKVRVQKLIAQLGSPNFLAREQAARELGSIGQPALKLLRQGVMHQNPEISGRAARLAAAIEEREQTRALLAPKMVHLKVSGMSVLDAVAELSSKAGYPLEVVGDRVPLAGRKITLDTGNVTFWEALRQLCEKGGLVEHAAAIVKYNKYQQPVPPNQRPAIFLMDGTPHQLPVCQQGTVRIRAMPADKAGLPAGETQIVLDICGETRLQDFGAVGMPFVKAVDERGQAVAMVEPESNREPLSATVPRFGRKGNINGVVVVNGNVMPLGGSYAPAGIPVQRSVAVRLKVGEKSARTLKEVTGFLTVQALGDTEVLVQVDDVLKSAGQKLKGKDGHAIEVHAIDKQADGSCKVTMTLENPAWLDPFAGRNLRLRGKFKGNLNNGVGYGFDSQSLPRLVDAQGKVCQPEIVSHSNSSSSSGQFVLNATVVYRPQAEPASLVLEGQRLVLFSVPFTLKNVPLP